MGKPTVLYHGSPVKIEGYLEPRKAKDRKVKINAQNAIYATDRIECAKGMSLVGKKRAFANYAEKDFKVVFLKSRPTKNKKRYVYEISSEGFKQTEKDGYQWFSKKRAKIVNVHEYKTEDLTDFWRMATKKEIKKYL